LWTGNRPHAELQNRLSFGIGGFFCVVETIFIRSHAPRGNAYQRKHHHPLTENTPQFSKPTFIYPKHNKMLLT